MILAGLLLLILTPVFRVGISIITFLKEKDYLYTVITWVIEMVSQLNMAVNRLPQPEPQIPLMEVCRIIQQLTSGQCCLSLEHGPELHFYW